MITPPASSRLLRAYLVELGDVRGGAASTQPQPPRATTFHHDVVLPRSIAQGNRQRAPSASVVTAGAAAVREWLVKRLPPGYERPAHPLQAQWDPSVAAAQAGAEGGGDAAAGTAAASAVAAAPPAPVTAAEAWRAEAGPQGKVRTQTEVKSELKVVEMEWKGLERKLEEGHSLTPATRAMMKKDVNRLKARTARLKQELANSPSLSLPPSPAR